MPKVVPLKILEGNLIGVYQGQLSEVQLDHHRPFLKGVLSDTIFQKISSYSPLLRRGLREGIHFYERFKDNHLLFKKNAITTYDSFGAIKAKFTGFQGFRPLNICTSPNAIFFGEYFGNPQRNSVRIWGTTDGCSWHEFFKFKPHQIRHIHGIQYDHFRKGHWVLTGDSNDESGLWFSDDHFKTLHLRATGSQACRAVSIHIAKDALIVPSDSPLEQNYIRVFNVENSTFHKVQPLPGSAFHCSNAGEILFVTTITESSEVNNTNAATIFASLDGVNWSCLLELPSDCFPISLQRYTRYAEIRILEGLWDNEFVVASGRALEAVSDGCLVWRYNDIKKALLTALSEDA